MSGRVTYDVAEVDGRTEIKAVMLMPVNKRCVFDRVGDVEMTERVKREMAAHLREYERWAVALLERHADEFGRKASL